MMCKNLFHTVNLQQINTNHINKIISSCPKIGLKNAVFKADAQFFQAPVRTLEADFAVLQFVFGFGLVHISIAPCYPAFGSRKCAAAALGVHILLHGSGAVVGSGGLHLGVS